MGKPVYRYLVSFRFYRLAENLPWLLLSRLPPVNGSGYARSI